ncbi:hypothetical protein SS50377_21596 [Spironucleus salmonicida]|uniref:Uncharacterized protein n=1 Tax=Spironucleus salmonicida TaxID=348837 RepID=V6LR09_9EUKA|nr:hypothetical protein SS50377_21596 [Spironucleus salmonicida]|eukprot:EST46141.1 Hypothetical protein SS50377_13858 [Spironucleus salmonicida]
MNLSDILTSSQSARIPYYNPFYTSFTSKFNKFSQTPSTTTTLTKIQLFITQAKKSKSLVDRFMYDEKCSLSNNFGLFSAVKQLQKTLQSALILLQATMSQHTYIESCEQANLSLEIVIQNMFHGFFEVESKFSTNFSVASNMIKFDHFSEQITLILDSLNVNEYQLNNADQYVHFLMKYIKNYVNQTDKLISELLVANNALQVDTKKLIDGVEIKYAGKITILEQEIERLKRLYSE